MKKLYVGNLPFTATDDQISQLFGQHGTVHSVALINDRVTRGGGDRWLSAEAAACGLTSWRGPAVETTPTARCGPACRGVWEGRW